jgi:hypothetical protein
MSPEEKSLLERTYKMAEENNEILKSLRRSARWNTAFKVFYWVIIIGISLGAYYVIQPYLESVMGIYGSVTGDVNGAQSVSDQLKDLLK